MTEFAANDEYSMKKFQKQNKEPNLKGETENRLWETYISYGRS